MHVIYIPGLGNGEDKGQRSLVAKWRRFGVHPHFYAMRWRVGAFDEKFAGLLALIDDLAKDGKVSLVGVSAGVSIALLAFAARPTKVAAVVTICGKVNHPEHVDEHYYLENPAFKTSLERVQKVLPQLDRSRILVVRPIWDGLVPVADMLLPGAQQKLLPTVGHGVSIALAISVFAPSIMRFLKTQAH
jgi:pimeloyl-ACP methyl ester carboxylesterase